MSRRTRFVVVLTGLLAIAAIVVATASALAFTDDSCDNTKPCRPPHGVVDGDYSFTLKAMPNSGNGPPYSFVQVGGSLPPGLSLSSAGPITGKPTQAGTWVVTVELQDNPKPAGFGCVARGSCASRDFTFAVDPRIMVTNQSPAPSTVGTPYTFQLQAVMKSDPNTTYAPSSPVTWSIPSGQLPPGLALDPASGAITGTPTTVGSYTFTALAVLDPTRSDTHAYTIVVRDAVKITGTGIAAARSEVSVPFSANLAATGGSGTFTWSLGAGSLPAGVTLGSSGSISGTPTEAGRFGFTAKVTDSENRTATLDGLLVVAQKLSIETRLLRLGKVGKLFGTRLIATGGVIPRTWKVTQGAFPPGVRMNRATGIIGGIPRRAGSFRITVQVSDGFNVVSTRSLRLTILPAPTKHK